MPQFFYLLKLGKLELELPRPIEQKYLRPELLPATTTAATTTASRTSAASAAA
jgi:hypothetical protein